MPAIAPRTTHRPARRAVAGACADGRRAGRLLRRRVRLLAGSEPRHRRRRPRQRLRGAGPGAQRAAQDLHQLHRRDGEPRARCQHLHRRRRRAAPACRDAAVGRSGPGSARSSRAPCSSRSKRPSAYARWRTETGVKLIARDGTVLSDTVSAQYFDLPLIAGQGANTAAEDAVALLDANPLYQIRTQAAVLVGERRWDLVLDTGATVMLPEDAPSAALDRLADLEMKGAITMEPVIVDMRLADRTVIELSPKDANELYIAPEEEQGFDEPADLLAAAIAESKKPTTRWPRPSGRRCNERRRSAAPRRPEPLPRPRRTRVHRVRARRGVDQGRVPDRQVEAGAGGRSPDRPHPRDRGDRLRLPAIARCEVRRDRQSGQSRARYSSRGGRRGANGWHHRRIAYRGSDLGSTLFGELRRQGRPRYRRGSRGGHPQGARRLRPPPDPGRTHRLARPPHRLHPRRPGRHPRPARHGRRHLGRGREPRHVRPLGAGQSGAARQPLPSRRRCDGRDPLRLRARLAGGRRGRARRRLRRHRRRHVLHRDLRGRQPRPRGRHRDRRPSRHDGHRAGPLHPPRKRRSG